MHFRDAAKILWATAKSMWTANRKSIHMRHDAKVLPGADKIHYQQTQNMLPEDVKETTATGSHSNTKLWRTSKTGNIKV